MGGVKLTGLRCVAWRTISVSGFGLSYFFGLSLLSSASVYTGWDVDGRET